MSESPSGGAASRAGRIGLVLAALAGVALTAWIVEATGWRGIAEAARRLGVGGFAVFCGWEVVVLAILGAAWVASAPPERWARVPLFAWARLVRESVAELLPLSQIGGMVAGAAVLERAGSPRARVWAAIVVDLSTEMASQLVFTLAGIALIGAALAGQEAAAVRPLVVGGLALMAALIAGIVFGQRAALRFAGAMAMRALPRAAGGLAAVEAELARIYRRRGRVAAAAVLNLLGWTASAVSAWLLLRLAGRPLPLASAVAMESLIFAVRSVAFAVPGALGLQEGAYVLIGPLVGLPPEAALALSLGKRARQLVWAAPTLAIWAATLWRPRH